MPASRVCNLLAAAAAATAIISGSLHAQAQPSFPECAALDSAGKCSLYEASLIQLIARPEVFDGKRVRVTGFIHFEFEGNGIYLHHEDMNKHLYSNGLWVELDSGYKPHEPCQDKYVLIEGRFEAAHHGHMGLWSGAITDITRCMAWG